MSLIKKLAGETVIYGLGSVLPRVLNFIVLTPYLTNVFSTEAYGVYGMIYAFSAFLMIMLTLRMETTFFRFGSKEGQANKSFSTASTALFVTTLWGIGTVLTFPIFFANLVTPSTDNAIYIQLIALVTGLDILCALPYAKLRLDNRPIRFAVIKIINVLVMLAVLFFLMKGLPLMGSSFYQEENLLQYPLIANIVGSLCGFVLLFPIYLKIKWTFDLALLKKMLWYAAPLIVVGIAGVVNNVLDRILIAKFISGDAAYREAQSGIYNASVKIAVLMQLFVTAFNYAAEPFFFKNAERSDSQQIYANVGQLFTIVACFAFLTVLLYIDIFQYLIGSDFREGLVIIPIILMAYLFQGLYYNFSIWYKLADKTWIGGLISIGGSIILLSINFALISSYGYIAAAWAALACFAFMAAASYLVGQKQYPIPYPIGRMMMYILGAVLVYGLAKGLRPLLSHLAIVLLVNTFLILFYIGVIWCFEKDSIQKMLK